MPGTRDALIRADSVEGQCWLAFLGNKYTAVDVPVPFITAVTVLSAEHPVPMFLFFRLASSSPLIMQQSEKSRKITTNHFEAARLKSFQKYGISVHDVCLNNERWRD